MPCRASFQSHSTVPPNSLGWITRVATSYRYKIDTLSNLKHDLDKKQSERDFSNCFHNFSLLVCCNQGKNVRNCFVFLARRKHSQGHLGCWNLGSGSFFAVHSLIFRARAWCFVESWLNVVFRT